VTGASPAPAPPVPPSGLEERRTALALVLLNLPFLLLNGLAFAPFLGSPDAFLLRVYVAFSFVLHFVTLTALCALFLWAVTRGRWSRWVGPVAAPFLMVLVQVFFLVDARIYSGFQFHMTGFILEVLLQDDAVKVLGLQLGEFLGFAAGVALVVAGEAGAWLLLRRGLRRWKGGKLLTARLRPRWIAVGAAAFALVLAAERLSFAVFYHRGLMEATAQARCLPFYVPVTMSRFLNRHFPGTEAPLKVAQLAPGKTRLNYPKAPLVPAAGERPLNVVWIVLEAWRPDFVTPEIMPATRRWGEDCLRGTRHLSGGNATRFGLFSMFYGIHAAMYEQFREERRGPVLLDHLLRRGYEMSVMSSAQIQFLGPKETVFVDVQDAIEDGFHDRDGAIGDRLMTDRWLSWLDGRRAPERPFFSFLFFDAPHPRFYFEPEFARFKPYLEDVSNIDQRRDQRDLILNRYRNSLWNVDHHLNRVFEALRSRKLLENSLVILTGDHGEEFWEHGHFTHSSAFTEEQLRVPLYVRAPGLAPGEIGRLSSHLDLPATVLELLGAGADPSGYSQGSSLLRPPVRNFVVASGYKDHAYIDDEVKVIFLSANVGMSLWHVTDADDEKVADPRGWLKRKSVPLLSSFKLLSEFTVARRR
jgi:hypothetical protein